MSNFKACIVLSLQYEQGLNYGYNLDAVKNVVDTLHKYNVNIPPIILLTNYKDLVVDNKRITEVRQVQTKLYKPRPEAMASPYGTIGFYKLDIFSIYDYDRIIYLDLDVLTKQNISELWNPQQFNKNSVYAFNEKNIPSLEHTGDYYNFGVMVINRSEMLLNEHMYKTMIMFANTRLPTKGEAEKDILNYVLNAYPGLVTIGNLPQEYNYFVTLLNTDEDFKRAKIIHFSAFPKPWRIKNPNSTVKKFYYRVLTEI